MKNGEQVHEAVKKLGVEPTIHQPVQMKNVSFGAWTEVGEHSYLENLELGDYSYTGPFCFVQNAVIGKFSNIAASVRIGPTAHPMERPTLHHFTYRRVMYDMADKDDERFFNWRAAQVTAVGHDTWIGHGAIIMTGLNIGNGAVVGSGSIVTKDVPPYTIAVGNPARVLRRRFDEETADRLERIAWWDWPHEVLKERLESFNTSASEFISRWEKE